MVARPSPGGKRAGANPPRAEILTRFTPVNAMRIGLLVSLIVIGVIAGAGSAVAATSAAPTASITPAQARPLERVAPAPSCNPNAVIWRTPEPPLHPQKGDLWVNPKDGMELIYLPAGEFTMGSSTAELQAWLEAHTGDEDSWFAEERPQCRIKLKAYWIGRTEVTNAQYRRFVEATGRDAPEHWRGGKIPTGLENFPVVMVEWDDAQAYCAWAGGRLPSEPEWERAARGGAARIFPWGNQWDRNRCRNLEALTGVRASSPEANAAQFDQWRAQHNVYRDGPAAAGSYPTGASPFGCADAAGNVWEWCADWYDGQAYERYAAGDVTPPAASATQSHLARGGSFADGHPRYFRCAWRAAYGPATREAFIGFRCAR
jgi:formylglycine-generating enzyme required for sulfatase activity